MTDVMDGLIVSHKGTIRVLQDGVGGEDGVAGLTCSCGNLGSWVNPAARLCKETTETRRSAEQPAASVLPRLFKKSQ